MATDQSPAFQFYFKDWRSSRRVQAMSFKERGMYLELLIEQWDKGPLPLAPDTIAMSIGAKMTEFRKCWPALQTCFERTADGWINRRLEAERQKQLKRRGNSTEWGKEGAQKRWAGHRRDDGQPIGRPSDQNASALSISFASAIASASSAPEIASPLPDPDASAKTKSLAPADYAERAGRLVERYGELYSEHLGGARYRSRPNLDWTEALTLVPLWSDERLEKLAILVLTTDDRWISGTDRSFKIFAMKASWADKQLTAWEAEHGIKVTA